MSSVINRHLGRAGATLVAIVLVLGASIAALAQQPPWERWGDHWRFVDEEEGFIFVATVYCRTPDEIPELDEFYQGDFEVPWVDFYFMATGPATDNVDARLGTTPPTDTRVNFSVEGVPFTEFWGFFATANLPSLLAAVIAPDEQFEAAYSVEVPDLDCPDVGTPTTTTTTTTTPGETTTTEVTTTTGVVVTTTPPEVEDEDELPLTGRAHVLPLAVSATLLVLMGTLLVRRARVT